MIREPLFPPEVTGNVPRITLTGNRELQVEQHRGLVRCAPEEIRLQTAVGYLTITGETLAFRYYTAQEAVIVGQITAVTLGQSGRQA